jgi:hypothetical protein
MDKQAIEEIKSYQTFLATLRLSPTLAHTKTIEMDLKGRLNPTNLLHSLFFEQKEWLGFQDFYQRYIIENEHLLKANFPEIDWEILKKGLEARLYRTQFGLLTEYHAYFACKCIFGSSSVMRDKELDKVGVDFQLSYQGEVYNIHIFVDTQRAWAFRKFKTENKSVEKVKGIHVNLPYSLKNNRFNSLKFLPNGFGIYTSHYLYYFKNELDKGNIKNNNIIATTLHGFVYLPSNNG